MTKKTNVLLIDDDVHMLDFMRSCIDGLDCAVLEAGNASEAMIIMNSIEIDVVITDFSMPVTSGIELTKMIRVINAEVPIVLCSSSLLLNEQDIHDAGVTKCIPKDFDHAMALRSFVNQHIGQKKLSA